MKPRGITYSILTLNSMLPVLLFLGLATCLSAGCLPSRNCLECRLVVVIKSHSAFPAIVQRLAARNLNCLRVSGSCQSPSGEILDSLDFCVLVGEILIVECAVGVQLRRWSLKVSLHKR